jgi:hypothetical protein
VHVAFEVPKDRGDSVDVVVEIETAGRHRDMARVLPVGDVDLVIGQKGFHSATEQRGEVAGHGRYKQQAGLPRCKGRVDIAPEMHKPAERRSPDGFLDDRNAVAGNPGRLNAERRFRVAARCAFKQLASGRSAASEGRMREGIERVEELQPHLGSSPPGPRGGVAELVPMIEHARYAARLRRRYPPPASTGTSAERP